MMMLQLLASSWLDGFRERAFYAPSQFQSSINGVSVDSCRFGPFGQALRFVVVCYQSIVARVAPLNYRCRPSAIFGTVWAIVVDTIQRHTERARTHIGQEGREGIAPAVTDCDAACAVESEPLIPWVGAAMLHAFPRPVFVGTDAALLAHAAAVNSPTAVKVFRCSDDVSFAVTPAFPQDVTVVTADWSNGNQHPEPLAHQVSCARIKYDCVSHACSPQSGMRAVRGRWSLLTITDSDYYPMKSEAFA